MTGDGNLNLIFNLSYLFYLSPSITDTHLFHSIVIGYHSSYPFWFTLYIFILPRYKLSVVPTHLTESEYQFTYLSYLFTYLFLIYSYLTLGLLNISCFYTPN